MTRSTRILGALAICAGLLLTLVAPVATEQAPPVNVPGIDKPVIVVTGEVAGTETWTTPAITSCAAPYSFARARRSIYRQEP